MKRNPEDTVLIRDATEVDNEGLLKLISFSTMPGRISIQVDRKPDFFRLLKRKGKYFVKAAEAEGRIVGSISVVEVDAFIDSKPVKAHYAGDFRVHPDYRSTGLAVRLVEEAYQQSVSQGAALFFGVLVMGNKAAASYLSGKLSVPPISEGSIFHVFQIIPCSKPIKYRKYNIDTIADFDFGMFRQAIKQYRFAPNYRDEIYQNTKIICARENGVVVAALSLADSEDVKQEVLMDVQGYQKPMIKLAGWINRINSRISLPQPGEHIRILYIRSFYCREGAEDALRALVSQARVIACQNKYHFLTVGIDERSNYYRQFSSFPKFTLKSRLYFCNYSIDPEVLEKLRRGVSFMDYSLV